MRGIVIRFGERGYGFIRCEGHDYLVHARNVPVDVNGSQRLNVNDEVEFNLSEMGHVIVSEVLTQRVLGPKPPREVGYVQTVDQLSRRWAFIARPKFCTRVFVNGKVLSRFPGLKVGDWVEYQAIMPHYDELVRRGGRPFWRGVDLKILGPSQATQVLDWDKCIAAGPNPLDWKRDHERDAENAARQ